MNLKLLFLVLSVFQYPCGCHNQPGSGSSNSNSAGSGFGQDEESSSSTFSSSGSGSIGGGGTGSTASATTNPSTPLYDVTSHFEFSKPQDMNKFGIFPTIMVRMEYKEGEKLHLWRANMAFTTDEIILGWEELCYKQHNTHFSEKAGDYLQWGNCTFTDNQMTALLEKGEEAEWHKNFTYLEIRTKPFLVQKGSEKKVCILNEFRDRKAYIVLMSSVFEEYDGPSEPIHKLDMFMPMALGFFEEVIEVDKILQFEPIDFLGQTKQYKCLIGIATGESNTELRANCRFKCVDKTELRTIKEVEAKSEEDSSSKIEL